jgi:hypothetical protein
MTSPSTDRVARFRELHARGIFVIANAWDAGSARVLAGLGFPAIATSSGAMANTLGRLDGRVSREEAIAHGRSLVEAVDVPVAADLENGFGDAPRMRPRPSGARPPRDSREDRSRTTRARLSTTTTMRSSGCAPRSRPQEGRLAASC